MTSWAAISHDQRHIRFLRLAIYRAAGGGACRFAALPSTDRTVLQPCDLEDDSIQQLLSGSCMTGTATAVSGPSLLLKLLKAALLGSCALAFLASLLCLSANAADGEKGFILLTGFFRPLTVMLSPQPG